MLIGSFPENGYRNMIYKPNEHFKQGIGVFAFKAESAVECSIWGGGVKISQHLQGAGAGTHMMIEAVDYLKSLGFKIMWLTVRSDNYPALRVYQRMGMSIVGYRFGDRGTFVMRMEV